MVDFFFFSVKGQTINNSGCETLWATDQFCTMKAAIDNIYMDKWLCLFTSTGGGADCAHRLQVLPSWYIESFRNKHRNGVKDGEDKNSIS